MESHSLGATRRRTVLRWLGLTLALPTTLCLARSPGQVVRPDSVDTTFWTAPRRITLVNANTKVDRTLTYWDGQYLTENYYELCRLLGDHHDGIAVQLDPRIFDLMYACQRWIAMATGNSTYSVATSGYRTPHTNMLVGGAPGGLHPNGRAVDGWLVGVGLDVYANMLLSFAAGGVGLYQHHVHADVGRNPVFWRGQSRES